jgi:TRAP-type C4-dicarboxylate transport system substrate-binding protein
MRTFILFVAFLIVASVFISLPIDKPAQAAPVRLSLVSSWTSPYGGNVKMEEFVKRLNARSTKVNIDFRGGAEIAPPLEALGHLQKGVFDLYFTTPTYHAGKVVEGLSVFYVSASPAKLREVGFVKLLDEIYRKKAGATILGFLWRGEPFGIFLNKPVTKADLTGLKIRSVANLDPFIKALGGATVTTPPSEIYSALERGVVDGYMLTLGLTIRNLGLQEVTKYVIYPWVPYESAGLIYANTKRWDGLPADVKKDIMDLILEMEPEVYQHYRTEAFREMDSLIAKGMRKIELPPAEVKKYFSLAAETGWNDNVLKHSPESGAKLKELVAPLLKQ